MPPTPQARQEFTLVLLAGAAGAGLIIGACRQTWARAVFTPPRPLPAQQVAVTGQQLVPLAGALALAALACLAAVIATRGTLRRAAGVLLAVLGAGAGAGVLAPVRAASVLAAATAAASTGALGGSTTSGTSSGGARAVLIAGSSGTAALTGGLWQGAAAAGAIAVAAAGLVTAWRGTRWPVMSARFDRSAGPARPAAAEPGTDSASMWESLTENLDPTVEDPAARAASQAPDPAVTREKPERRDARPGDGPGG